MLIYHGYGPRRYDLRKLGLTSRRFYEFQAVIRGSIAMTTEEGEGPLRSRWLWLSAPQMPHGWSGSGGPAEVVVFHFLTIPAVLDRLVKAAGCIGSELTASECRRLKTLSAQALRYANPPSAATPLCHEQIVTELSLLLLEKAGNSALPPDPASQRVEAALLWYLNRMKENPSLEEVARAVGSSPANLRRGFLRVMNASPKAIFDQSRMQRAMQLLTGHEVKIEVISEACGFGSASAFSRAFKQKTGLAPEVWRSGETRG